MGVAATDKQLPIYFTKLYATSENLPLQKDTNTELFQVQWEHPSVRGIILWGYQYQSTFVQTDLMDENNLPNPAFQWLQTYFNADRP